LLHHGYSVGDFVPCIGHTFLLRSTIYIGYCVLDIRQADSNTPGVLFAQLTAVNLVTVQLPALRVDDIGKTTGLVTKCYEISLALNTANSTNTIPMTCCHTTA